MVHYVCSQCGTQSSRPGVCENENCINNGSALTQCNCEDGKHADVLKDSSPDQEENNTSNSSEQTLDLDSDIS